MGAPGLSRRDFLRLRRTDRGRVVELSCHALFMRCADATLDAGGAEDWEPWMGEPPLDVERRSAVDLLASIEHELQDAQVVRLLDAQWLDAMDEAAALRAVLDRFRARGGVVERT